MQVVVEEVVINLEPVLLVEKAEVVKVVVRLVALDLLVLLTLVAAAVVPLGVEVAMMVVLAE